jgi:hypothetical protein
MYLYLLQNCDVKIDCFVSKLGVLRYNSYCKSSLLTHKLKYISVTGIDISAAYMYCNRHDYMNFGYALNWIGWGKQHTHKTNKTVFVYLSTMNY